ncbi:MAG: putative bifunctional diguanylate cyclase/phosphodiesterase [Lautropia sp.]
MLLIEDDPSWQHLVSVGLGERGIDVQIVDQFSKAVSTFERVVPDAVLVDDILPDADGLEAVRRLREIVGTRQVPIVMLSSRDDDDMIDRAFQAGVSDFFLKSLQWTLLSERLLHLVSAAKAQAALADSQKQLDRVKDMASLAQESVRSMRQQSYRDSLTGLASRTGFLQQGEELLRQRRPSGHCAAVLMVNLDRFKRFNDSLGQKTGDRVLVEVAKRLQHAFRNLAAGTAEGHSAVTDVVRAPEATRVPGLLIGRLSGDEFALMFSDLPSQTAVEKTADIAFAHLRRPFSFDGLDMLLRCSIGMAVYPAHGRNIEALLAKADAAVGIGKRQGGNVAVMFSDEFGEHLRNDFDLEAALHTAVDRNELVLHYQPIVEAKTGKVSGAEALMRWMRGGQMITPTAFIPLAEESGLVFRMGEWAISEALQQVRRWQMRGLGLGSVSVNINVRHLVQPSLMRAVTQALHATQLPPSTLTLELTESDVMQDIEKALSALRVLKELGVRLALDDFGTGYSSLAYLTQLPLDSLKIDRSFIREMQSNPQQLMVVRGIVALGSALGLQTTAEGVENREELVALQKMGVQLVQGYYFTRPLTATDFDAWWRASNANPGMLVAPGLLDGVV